MAVAKKKGGKKAGGAKRVINVSLTPEAAEKVAQLGWGQRSSAISKVIEKHLKVPKAKA